MGDGWMQIPAVENTEEGLSRAMYLVAHECGHEVFSQLDIKEKAGKKDKRLHSSNISEPSVPAQYTPTSSLPLTTDITLSLASFLRIITLL